MLTPLDTEASRSPLLNDGNTARDWAVYQSGRLWDFWERLFQVWTNSGSPYASCVLQLDNGMTTFLDTNNT